MSFDTSLPALSFADGGRTQHTYRRISSIRLLAGFLFILIALLLVGCGSGGYAGQGITGVSTTAFTIDATQSYGVSVSKGEGPLTWKLSGTNCSGSTCGSTSPTDAKSVLYTAPDISQQTNVVLTGTLAGTLSSTSIAITVNPLPVITGVLPTATVGVPYTATVKTSGGTAPLTLSLGSGSLPNGLSFDSSTGIISGTPTTVGTTVFTLQVKDSSIVAATILANKSITVTADGSSNATTLAVLPTTLHTGLVGSSYTDIVTASGGTAPYTWAIVSGTLPDGLALAPTTGTIAGNPTRAGISSFVAQVTDSTGATAVGAFSVAVYSSFSITSSTLPGGTVGVSYGATLTAVGGSSPYTWSILSGALPTGLSLTSTGTITGTPTAIGTYSFIVQAIDANGNKASASFSIVVTNQLAVLSSNLPAGTVGTAYKGSISASGGTAPYTWNITAGALPAGLTLASTTGAITGNPTTAETSTFTMQAIDSNGDKASATFSITITNQLTVLSSNLPAGTVGVAYTGTLSATGGTAPYTWSIVSGSLPNGLTLSSSSGTISGTPTTTETATFTAQVKDANGEMATAPLTIRIYSTLTITNTALPSGYVGTIYTTTLIAAGGSTPYTWSITTGALPTGLALDSTTGVISGTPTTADVTQFAAQVTDANGTKANQTLSLTVYPALSITATPSVPNGVIHVPYNAQLTATGGMTPYTWSSTTGTLPGGLLLSSNGSISGTPTATGTFTFTVQVKDQNEISTTASVSITIYSGLTITTTGLANGYVGQPYTDSILAQGGTSPYTCAIAGTLPSGLTANNCTVSGTPTTAGTASLSVTVTDASSPSQSVTGPVTLTIINPALSLTGTLPNAVVNQTYSQILPATGGTAPYTYSITSGSLPSGLSLDTSSGRIYGVPTIVGASRFTLTATDSASTPATANLSLLLQVVYATTPDDAKLKGPYAFIFQGYDDVLLGVLAYHTASVGSFTADGTGLVSQGELDSNHQAANSVTGSNTTVDTNSFVGSYTIGSDNRGMITITTFNTDQSIRSTNTYAIALKAPATTNDISTEGDLIEYDGEILLGSKGSGTLLAQKAADFTSGFNGNYAFGLSGDSPCLPSCTIGILAGPDAAVGQFQAANGMINNGTIDTNIASKNYPSVPLTGTFGSADTNGRIQLSLKTASLLPDTYPTNFAVYLVDSTHAFFLSTDVHSSHILLAGNATQQSSNSYTNAALSGPYIGYENTSPDPGLLDTVLTQVLNASTVTVFRGVADGSGNNTFTEIRTGGLNGLLNNLTGGIGNILGVSLLDALLGKTATTGDATYTVSSNGRFVLNYVTPNGVLSPVLDLFRLGSAPLAPRVGYLTSPGTGYFLETSYAGLGNIEAQTGAPFSKATFQGTYVYGTTPPAGLANITTSGILAADGNGSTTSIQDLNIGIGNLNILQLGVLSTQAYQLQDATAGRYSFGATKLIYAISPGRFVLIDTDPLTTAPTLSLLY